MDEPSSAIDLGYSTQAHGRIPSFANVEEEAAFWDSHDFTDFLEESRPVQITVGKEITERLMLRHGLAEQEVLAEQQGRE